MTISNYFNIAARPTAELKGLYQILFNKLTLPNLTKHQAQKILGELTKVRSELSNRFEL